MLPRSDERTNLRGDSSTPRIANVMMRLCATLVLIASIGNAASAYAQNLEERLLKESSAALAADAREQGDPARGAAIFYARTIACSTCHSVGDREGAIGPDLAKVDPKTTDVAIVESVLTPSKVIAPLYSTVTIETNDGRIINGLPVNENEERLVLRDMVQFDKLITVLKSEVAQRSQTKQSIMPAGQVNQLSDRRQFLDLVRYLIDIREGGPKRARELQPPPSPLSQEVPDRPLPWRPVVQRGELELEGGQKYPHGVAIGFEGGSLLFDANLLGIAATWSEGYVVSRPQNYFGLWWTQAGKQLEKFSLEPNPLTFKLSEQSGWQAFQPASTSDPNTGTRFDGYQIGKASVRMHYRVLVGEKRISVAEDIRAEVRPEWQGHVREFRFTGLPNEARVSLLLPVTGQIVHLNNQGEKLAGDGDRQESAYFRYSSGEKTYVVRSPMATYEGENRLVSLPAKDGEPLVLRVDQWRYRGTNLEPALKELASLAQKPPVLDDKFDLPIQPSKTLPEVQPVEVKPLTTLRPGVNPKENVDEFPVATGRFVRFTVTRTNDGSAPGIDELEVWGPDAKESLSATGKATASTVINGYSIHQIPHLNDGKLGNNFSWISAENGGGWAQIEFPQPVKMNKLVWARDRTGICKDRLAVAYRIEISDDGKKWTKVGDDSGRAAFDSVVGMVRRDAAPGYALESIPPPFPACRPSDITFSNDGILYATAMTEGQVWRTRIPPPGEPERVEWQRFATGLYHPLGMQMVDGRLYVAQKTEITELIDRDGDGCADHFRTVATGWGLSTGWHEYCFGLAVDAEKNLWVALNTGYFWTNPGYVNPGRWRGSILRVSAGSEKLEVVAKGCRVPNGIASGTGGGIFFTDNQGDWIQSCKLAHIVPGRFYGHPEYKEDALPKGTYPNGKSAVWLPYERSRSSSGPVWDSTQGKFGPFADQMFLGDVGYGANLGIMRIALEKVNGEYQGACFRFVDGQPSGCERMKFGPDNQLYMASLSTGLTRMKYEDKMPAAIHSLKIRPKGIGFTVHLTKPLAADAKLVPEQFKVRRYHYLYTGQYGSPEADSTNVVIEKVELSTDRKQLTLTFPVETYPIGMVYAFNFGDPKFDSGEGLAQNEAWYTVQQIPD